MTRVLVVDDSQFMRTVLTSMLSEHGYDVVTASDGESALEAVRSDCPDVVTMDVEMPGMDGIEAVRRITAEHPVPILMLSAYTEDGADATLEALAEGAIDFIPKPGGELSPDIGVVEDELVDTIEAVVSDGETATRGATAGQRAEDSTTDATSTGTPSAPVGESVAEATDDVRGAGGSDAASLRSSTPSAAESAAASAARSAADAAASIQEANAARRDGIDQSGTTGPASQAAGGPQQTDRDDADLAALESPTVVIGASTGGPRIVEELLAELPVALGARVLLVQHMPENFTTRLAERLDTLSEYDVREATEGTRVLPGQVVVAKGGQHMAVTEDDAGRLEIRLDDGERVHGVRPAIDVTMESVAETVDDPLVAVALTGMGRDGAAGVSAVKAVGGTTIAQDEASAPVFGIPRQAIATGDVDRVLPATEISDAIVDAAEPEVPVDA